MHICNCFFHVLSLLSGSGGNKQIRLARNVGNDQVSENQLRITRAVLRLVWPSILLQPSRGRVATAAAMGRHVRKTA